MNATRYEFTTRTAIHLKTKHGEVNVHQSCSEYIIARHPINIPPGEATLVLASADEQIHELFGERSPDVFALLFELGTRHGVWMLDARPANIRF